MSVALERSRTPAGVPRGYFLTFEGIEGSGKSTHARLLAEALTGLGYRICLTREPGGTALGERIRDVVLRAPGEPLSAEAELFLILAARAQHVRLRILPHLDRGEIVLCDRYADASLAYQGGGRGLGLPAVIAANRLATGGLFPDATILCDVTVKASLDRVRAREAEGGEANRFDREEADFHEAVRRSYLDLARTEPERFLVVDTSGPRDEAAARIVKEVTSRLTPRRAEGALL